MLTKFLDQIIGAPTDSNPSATPLEQLQQAVAVLLVDVARADWEHAPEERAVVLEALQQQFRLSATDATALIDKAESLLDVEASLHAHLTTLNNALSPQEKAALIERMWEIAFADGRLSKYEEHTIRRLADLLHVPHRAFIQAKHKHHHA